MLDDTQDTGARTNTTHHAGAGAYPSGIRPVHSATMRALLVAAPTANTTGNDPSSASSSMLPAGPNPGVARQPGNEKPS